MLSDSDIFPEVSELLLESEITINSLFWFCIKSEQVTNVFL